MQKNLIFVDLGGDIFDRHGIYALSAILMAEGHNVTYATHQNREKLLNTVALAQPDLVMYSSYSTTLRDYAKFDKALKQRISTTSLIGGPGITFNPEMLFTSTIDAGCVGEGDLALPTFIASGFSKCSNIFLNDGKLTDAYSPFAGLDTLPLPTRELVYKTDSVRRDNPTKTFVSGRGCPFKCTYCFNHTYNKMFRSCGPTIRKKSVDYVLEEIANVLARYPLKTVAFNDDTFIVDSRWFFEFAERFSSRFEISYSCNIRANLMTEDIARVLSSSRCSAVNWSIESGDAVLRNTLLKRNMSDKQILFTAEMLNKYKLKHRIGNVIGLPGETPEQVDKTIDLNIRCRPDLALANIFVPFPGLDLTRMAIEGSHYDPLPDDKLPQNYFTKSVLKFDNASNSALQKTLFLFSLFTSMPLLYTNKTIRKALHALPHRLLRIFYEIYYAYKLKNFYGVSGDFVYTVKAVLRYFNSLAK